MEMGPSLRGVNSSSFWDDILKIPKDLDDFEDPHKLKDLAKFWKIPEDSGQMWKDTDELFIPRFLRVLTAIIDN